MESKFKEYINSNIGQCAFLCTEVDMALQRIYVSSLCIAHPMMSERMLAEKVNSLLQKTNIDDQEEAMERNPQVFVKAHTKDTLDALKNSFPEAIDLDSSTDTQKALKLIAAILQNEPNTKAFLECF